jgi:hypothetical protein
VISPQHLRAVESYGCPLTAGFRLFEGLAKYCPLLIVGPNSYDLIESLLNGFGFLQRIVTEEEHREMLLAAAAWARIGHRKLHLTRLLVTNN